MRISGLGGGGAGPAGPPGPLVGVSCVVKIDGAGNVEVLPGARGVAVGINEVGGAQIVADATSGNAITLTFADAFETVNYALEAQLQGGNGYFSNGQAYETPTGRALGSVTFYLTGPNGFIDPAVGFSGTPIAVSVMVN